jgi:hypothetical protein
VVLLATLAAPLLATALGKTADGSVVWDKGEPAPEGRLLGSIAISDSQQRVVAQGAALSA